MPNLAHQRNEDLRFETSTLTGPPEYRSVRLIFKTIIWFSVVLFLIAQDRGVLDRVNASLSGDELNIDTILLAQELLDRAKNLCENHEDKCRQLGELAAQRDFGD